MQSHRLARLLRVIVQIRTQPQKSPEAIARDLGVSTRQFYYDRNRLAEMGFEFSRTGGRFSVTSDPAVTIGALPLSEILALVLATRHLFATKDFFIVRRALDGLFAIVDHMQGPQRHLLKSVIQDVIIRDGFGCAPEILEDLFRAVDEKRRIVIHSRQRSGAKPQSVDPYELCFRKSTLYLDAYAVERKKRIRYRVANINKVIFTLFYRPENVRFDSS